MSVSVVEHFCSCVCIACVTVYRERVRQRERSLPHCNRCVAKEGDKRSLLRCFSIFLYLPLIVIFCSLWAAVVFPTFGFSTLTLWISSLFICCFLCKNRQLGCGRVQWNQSNSIKVVSELGLLKRYGWFTRRHVQAHRLLLSVEVEDEGHARG